MEIQDISENTKVISLWNLSRQLRETTTLDETMRAIRQALTDVYGPLASVILGARDLRMGEYRIEQLNIPSLPGSDPMLVTGPTIYRGGVMGEIISVAEPRLLQKVDWSADPVFGKSLAGFESVAAIPVSSDRLSMSWVVLLRQAPAVFGPPDLEEALLRTALVGSLLESQDLVADLAKANARIDREMRQTGELQRMLLPDPLPRIPGLEMAVNYETSGRAGGDLYDVFLLEGTGEEQNRWCVLMADASGHGLVAAVVMAIVQSILRAHPSPITGPADLLSHINRHLCQKNIGGFVTAFLAIYTPGNCKLTYSDAGHPAPLKRTAAGVSSLHANPGLPLGIEPTTTFAENFTYLVEGDTLLLYTDGITDARNPRGEMFDTPRLESEFGVSNVLPHQVITYLRERVNQHQDGGAATDDQTMLAIRMTG